MRNFILAYTGREGSTAIIRGLANHSRIVVPLREDLDRRHMSEEDRRSLPTILDRVLATGVFPAETAGRDRGGPSSGADAAIGFKWRLWSSPRQIAPILIRHDVLLFHLKRRDFVNWCLSLYFSHEILGEGRDYHPQFAVKGIRDPEARQRRISEIRNRRFAVDIDRFAALASARFDWALALWARVEHLRELGVATAPVHYEDFVDDGAAFLADMLGRIGLPYEPDVLSIKFEKVNRADLRGQIDNLDVVAADRRVDRMARAWERLVRNEIWPPELTRHYLALAGRNDRTRLWARRLGRNALSRLGF